MAIIKVSINNKVHQIACQDGEEEHLQALANSFSERISSLAKSYPNATDLTLYMMAGIMLSDELHEAKKLQPQQPQQENAEDAVVKTIDMVTEHLEYIAKKFDK